MVALKNLDVFQLEKNINGNPGSCRAKDLIMYIVQLVIFITFILLLGLLLLLLFSVFHSLLMVAGVCYVKVQATSHGLGALTFYLMLP